MKRHRRFELPPVALDRESPRPLYRQVQDALGGAIRSGALPAGARLPSTRMMAGLLGVSRITVLTAYDALAADGLIHAKVGSGTRVGHVQVVPGARAAGWRDLIHKSNSAVPAIWFTDPDGNLLYVNT